MTDEDLYLPLMPLFHEARAKRLWFHTSYQDLWFSPDDLARANATGRFRWGPSSWTLRDPAERLLELDRKIAEAQKERDQFAARLRAEGYPIPEPVSVEAWLFFCQRPGKSVVFVSLDSSGSESWPWDEWATVRRLALAPDGEWETVWTSSPTPL